MLQLDLGYNPISILEVVSALNINNISDDCLYYNPIDRPKKYNPKVYIGSPTSLGDYWDQDYNFTPTLTWPESYQ